MEINQPAAKFQDVSIAPMHTAEHILNATMVKMFGCPRSRNAHPNDGANVRLPKKPQRPYRAQKEQMRLPATFRPKQRANNSH